MRTPRATLYEQNETPGGSIYWEPHVERIPIPVEGAYYDTIDEALDMYTKYAEMARFEIKKRGQRLTKSGDVHYKYIYCNKEGVPKGINVDTLDPEYSDKQKKNTTTHVTGCKARIRLVRNIVNGRYKLEQFQPKHNHMLILKEYKHFTKKQRKMNQLEKMFVVKAATNKIGATRAHNLLCSMKGGMSVVYVLTTPIPDDGDDATVDQLRKRAKWDNDGYVCRGLILNGMSDYLFDIYQNVESFKELWGSLKAKYMADNASSKKFLVSCIIDKLLPLWKDIKHTLKHLKEELTLVELGSHMCIEESLKMQDIDKPKGNNVAGPSVVNMVEHNNSSMYNDNKGKRKHHDNTKVDPNKKSKVTCWKCGKSRHLKKDCKDRKVGNKSTGSGTNGSVDGFTNSLKGQNMFNKSFQVYYVTYVSEAYFVQDDDVTWWVDSGKTFHVCKDRCWFKTYESLNDGSILYMRNESTALVHGRGCVDLKFSSGKIVSLFNVLHVPNIRKNLVSSSVLNNYGYKQVIKSNKFVLSKHGVFIGFSYLSNEMFRLNIINDNIASTFMSTSKLNDSMLWHARLGNVHFKRMQDMSKYGLIPAFDVDIENDLCDLHATPSLKNEKYFVTLIDDASRFCYVHLLHSKDEALDKFKVFKTEVELQQGSQIKRFRTDRGETKPELPQVWGCKVVVRLSDPKLKTLGERGIECIFVGYAKHSKAFRFYVIEPNDSVSIKSIIESMDAIFDENRFSSVPRTSLRIPNRTEDIGGSVILEEVTEEVLVDLPPGCKPLGCKWIFKRKLKVDRTIEKFKARLVIHGFKQKSRIDYCDTYALVARINTIRMLIAMASIHNLIIHHMDVKTTFLNGDLEEEVYMNQPQGFIMPANENKVCKLIKSLYGLKQTPKQWHQKFDEVVLSNSYLLNQADKCVYRKFDEIGKGVIVCLYVDDMLIFGTGQVQVDLTKEFLSSSYFDCTLVSTHMDTSEKLIPNNGQAVSQLDYSRVIGCLMYVMTCTRPDITFVVGKLSRYTSNSGTQHWQAIQWVLKYLNKTMDYRLTYTGYPSMLKDYTNASWISNTEDNSSTSGWVFLLGGGAISWASKKQICITGSTIESEFVALAYACKEAE
nr:zinc finger, CCHC-type [Tanacetum cinerariifolium]